MTLARTLKRVGRRGQVTSANSRGIMMLCGGLFIFSFQDVIVKLLSTTFPVHQLVFVRGIVALPIVLLAVHYDSGFASLRSTRPALHVFRSLAMLSSYLFFYLAIAAVSIPAAVTLFFTAPLMITALSAPVLGEPVGWRRWLGVTVGLAGVVVMVRPEGGQWDPALLMALASALCYALSAIMARKLGVTDSASVMAFYSTLVYTYAGAIMGLVFHFAGSGEMTHPSLAFLTRPWSMPFELETAMMVTTGVISVIGFILLSQAYRVGEPAAVAPFEYTSMIWATVLTYAVWGSVPDQTAVAGAALIIGAGIYVLRREGEVRDKPLAAKGPYRNR